MTKLVQSNLKKKKTHTKKKNQPNPMFAKCNSLRKYCKLIALSTSVFFFFN